MHKRKPETEPADDITCSVPGVVPVKEMDMPYWEKPAVHEHSFPPHSTWRQMTITETTNDKEWSHREDDLRYIGRSIDQLKSWLVIFGVSVVALVVVMLIYVSS